MIIDDPKYEWKAVSDYFNNWDGSVTVDPKEDGWELVGGALRREIKDDNKNQE